MVHTVYWVEFPRAVPWVGTALCWAARRRPLRAALSVTVSRWVALAPSWPRPRKMGLWPLLAARLGERPWLSVCPCMNSGWMFLSWDGSLRVFCSICLSLGVVEEHLENDEAVNLLGRAESSLGWAWNLTLKQVFLWFRFKRRRSVDFQKGETRSSLHKAICSWELVFCFVKAPPPSCFPKM